MIFACYDMYWVLVSQCYMIIHTTSHNNYLNISESSNNLVQNLETWSVENPQKGSSFAKKQWFSKIFQDFGMNSSTYLSMGWLKGKSTGNHGFSHEIHGIFLIFFPQKPINWMNRSTIFHGKTMERSDIFYGKTHDFAWAIFHSYVTTC